MASQGAAGFAKGFATGFINERNRRLDEQKETDQMSLKYRLEAAAQAKSDWQKKQEEEQGQIDQAKRIAKINRDESLAPAVIDLVKSGYNVGQIQEMIDNGQLKKQTPTESTVKIPNPDLTPAKVPLGVAMTPADVGKNPLEGITPPESATGTTTTTVKAKPETTPEVISEAPANEEFDKIDAKAREIAPDLFKTPNKTPDQILTADSQWKYTAPQKEVKLGTIETETYKLAQARQNNDKEAIANQELKIHILESQMTKEAVTKARAEGKNIRLQAVVDNKGKFVKVVPVAMNDAGEYVNAATDKSLMLPEGYTTQDILPEQLDDINKMDIEFRKAKTDYTTKAESTAEVVGINRRVFDLLAKPGNDVLPTTSASILRVVDDTLREVQTVQKMIDNQIPEVDKALESGDPLKISGEIARLEQRMLEVDKEAVKIPQEVLSRTNSQIALDKTLYENYMTLLTYKFAAANKQSGNELSGKDVEYFRQMIGANSKNAESVKAILTDLMKIQISNVDKSASNLKNDFKDAGRVVGLDLGYEGRRMGDMFTNDQDRRFFDSVNKGVVDSKNYTKQQIDKPYVPGQAQQNQNQEIPQDIPRPKSKAEYDQIPDGTRYWNPKLGKVVVKGARVTPKQ